jgi:hypothetical protein
MEQRQKNAADRYSKRVITLMNSAKEASSLTALEQIWRDLLAILAEAVQDLDNDNLSEESLRSILEIPIDVTRDRRAILTAEGVDGSNWRLTRRTTCGNSVPAAGPPSARGRITRERQMSNVLGRVSRLGQRLAAISGVIFAVRANSIRESNRLFPTVY